MPWALLTFVVKTKIESGKSRNAKTPLKEQRLAVRPTASSGSVDGPLDGPGQAARHAGVSRYSVTKFGPEALATAGCVRFANLPQVVASKHPQMGLGLGRSGTGRPAG